MDFSTSPTEIRIYCKYKTPDCRIVYNNFMRSLNKTKESKSKLMVEFANQIQSALDKGVTPIHLHPILKFVNINKKHLFKK